MYKTVYSTIGVILLTTLLACTAQLEHSSTSNPTPIESSSTNQKPPSKTAYISVEGETTKITLNLYHEESSLFTTYFPSADFVTESVASNEFTSVRFYANFAGLTNKTAYVQISNPNHTTTVEQLKQTWLDEQKGLFTSNQWQVVNKTQEKKYPWAKEKIVFNQAQNNITGTVYFGESQGKAFYVVTHYPAEYGDGFVPRANLILQNLEIKNTASK